jgi:hypothetical protein
LKKIQPNEVLIREKTRELERLQTAVNWLKPGDRNVEKLAHIRELLENMT